MELRNVLLIALGGALGSVARYGFTVITKQFPIQHLPLATLAVNLIGCLLIGLLSGFALKLVTDQPFVQFFLITGFCGGFTTFSAFAYENLRMMQQGNLTLAAVYVLLSVVLGIAAVLAGLYIAK